MVTPRQARRRPDLVVAAQFAPRFGRRVGPEVVAVDRPSLAQGLCRGTAALWCVRRGADRQLRDVAADRPGAGDLDHRTGAVDRPDPRAERPALLDRDPADGAEQCLVVAGPQDRLVRLRDHLVRAAEGANLQVRSHPFGDVDDGGERPRPAGGVDRGEADLDGELAGVLAPGRHLQADAHRAGGGVLVEPGAVRGVRRRQVCGNQHLDRPPFEFFGLVTERGRCRSIGVRDEAFGVHADDGVGRGVEQLQERIAWEALVARHKDDVSRRGEGS